MIKSAFCTGSAAVALAAANCTLTDYQHEAVNQQLGTTGRHRVGDGLDEDMKEI